MVRQHNTFQAALIALLLVIFACPAVAQKPLQDILRVALVRDPSVLEARANEAAARSKVKEAQALHYPVIAVTGNQILSQSHKNKADEQSTQFTPGVKATLNVFSWGAIKAQVNQEREVDRYYYYKYYETREKLGNVIAGYYLEALRAKEALDVMQLSLERHNRILHDLQIITKYDPGRRSELVQAQARQLQARQSIAQYQRTLNVALSRLATYTDSDVRAEDLVDPFVGMDTAKMVQKFSSEDMGLSPTYLAQKAELESIRASIKVNKAKRLPSVNLEGTANRDDSQVYMNVTWNVLDLPARQAVATSTERLAAAESRLDIALREAAEQTRTAEVQMRESENQINVSGEQIFSAIGVAQAYDLQFKIARKTLIEVLNAYNELTAVELSHATAKNDFRASAMAYLSAQAKLAQWAGVPSSEYDGRY